MEHEPAEVTCPDLNTLSAAELFARLSVPVQDEIIDLIKSLLSHE